MEYSNGKVNKAIVIGGSALGLLILVRKGRAATSGEIVASEPLIYGQCVTGACLQDTEVIAYVTFKNIGGVYRENIVGISVGGVSVKEQTVGLNPGTGFTMAYTFNMTAGTNNICGYVR